MFFRNLCWRLCSHIAVSFLNDIHCCLKIALEISVFCLYFSITLLACSYQTEENVDWKSYSKLNSFNFRSLRVLPCRGFPCKSINKELLFMKQVVPLSQFLKGGHCCSDGDFSANFPLSSVICSVFQFVCFVLYSFISV